MTTAPNLTSALAIAAAALIASGCALPRSPLSENPQTIRATPVQMEVVDEALAAGDEEEALRILTLAIEQNPTLTVAHLKMGEIYRVRGDYNEAERSYATAARLEPRNFDAQYNHGLTLHLLNRLADAVRAYLRALSIRPNDFQANLNLATAYLQLEEPSQALAYAERAVRLEPTSGPARANLGSIFAALDRHNDAVRQFESAAELMELSPELLLNLADSLGRIGRFEQMQITLDAVVELDPSAPAWERVGYARFKLRDYSGAQSAFRESLNIDTRHFPALNGLAVCLLNEYLQSNRQDETARREAIDLLRRSLQINRNQPRIAELLSRYG